jgi:hypoxanthine phosphoribosyltransferase
MKKLITEKELRIIIKRLGNQITKDYHNTSYLIVVGLLKGSFVFMADLIRQINLPLQVDFMTVSSYKENKQESEIKVILDLNTPIYNKHVLVVEDIIDSGRTFSKVLNLLRSRHPATLKTCVLLNKKECRILEEQVDYCGIEIPDVFVCGYGLDDNQKQRNLPYIGIIDG